VLGLPLSPLCYKDVLGRIRELIERNEPSHVITANLNYAMLSHEDSELREVNRRAAFLVADGMPLVWASRRCPRPIPERVAGSDLIYDIARIAADLGRGIFLLGGAEGIAATAAESLRARYPDLRDVASFTPPFRPTLTEEDTREILTRIHAARPAVLLVALSQPKGELWIASHLEEIGVPLCIQLGASFDFVAGRVSRAPRWIQLTGLEWMYRLALEPQRLFARYWSNGLFYASMMLRGPSAWRDDHPTSGDDPLREPSSQEGSDRP
jgi:N-acetylglucosaminyldiphosphoundecaprenol N-acetyl-beta-D-mannosaminyltransferase